MLEVQGSLQIGNTFITSSGVLFICRETWTLAWELLKAEKVLQFVNIIKVFASYLRSAVLINKNLVESRVSCDCDPRITNTNNCLRLQQTIYYPLLTCWSFSQWINEFVFWSVRWWKMVIPVSQSPRWGLQMSLSTTPKHSVYFRKTRKYIREAEIREFGHIF